MLILPTAKNYSSHFRGRLGFEDFDHRSHHSFGGIEEDSDKNSGMSDDFDIRSSFRTACAMRGTDTMRATYIYFRSLDCNFDSCLLMIDG